MDRILGNNCGIKTLYKPATWQLDYDSMPHISCWFPLEFSLSWWDEDWSWCPACAVAPDPPENFPCASCKHNALTLCRIPVFCHTQEAISEQVLSSDESFNVQCGLCAEMALLESPSLSFRAAHLHRPQWHKPHLQFQFLLNLIRELSSY